jgi:HTH-type transcriptional regulator/antitoxin HigA
MPEKKMKTIDPDLYVGLLRKALALPPQTEADNERLIRLLYALDEGEALTPEEQAFAELLGIVIEDFEDRHYSLPAVAPDDALRALMEDRGLQHKDLAAIVGNKGLTTEILVGRQKISRDVAKKTFRKPQGACRAVPVIFGLYTTQSISIRISAMNLQTIVVRAGFDSPKNSA